VRDGEARIWEVGLVEEGDIDRVLVEDREEEIVEGI